MLVLGTSMVVADARLVVLSQPRGWVRLIFSSCGLEGRKISLGRRQARRQPASRPFGQLGLQSAATASCGTTLLFAWLRNMLLWRQPAVHHGVQARWCSAGDGQVVVDLGRECMHDSEGPIPRNQIGINAPRIGSEATS